MGLAVFRKSGVDAVAKSIELRELGDLKSGLLDKGFDPFSVRLKIMAGFSDNIGNFEGCPIIVKKDTTAYAIEAEFRKAVVIHNCIPEASVKVLAGIYNYGMIIGYVMENIEGPSIYGRFRQIMKTDEDAAKEEYISDFKKIRRSINEMNFKLVGHGDIHESNIISGKLIDPQPYFANGYIKRPEAFILLRDRSWLSKMAERVARLTGSSESELKKN